MEDGLFTLLEALGILLMSLIPAVAAWRFMLSRQRLPYGQGMAGRLLRWGLALSLLAGLLIQGIRLMGFGSLLAPLEGMAQPAFRLLSVLIETGLKLAALHFLVLCPRHYANRFDLMIYAVSLGLGDGILRGIALALTGDTAASLRLGLPLVLLPMVIQALMGFCLMRFADSGRKDRKWLALALTLPALAQFTFDILGNIPVQALSPWQWALFALMILASLWGVNQAALHNRTYPGQDAQAIREKETQRHTLRHRAAYLFDNLMARGNLGPIGLLAVFSLLAAVGLALIIYWKAPAQVNHKISNAIWSVSMRMLDSGNLAPDLATGNAHFVWVGVLATLLGLVSLSSLIGLISSLLDQKLDRLRSGHSRILERGHVLMLGMSEEALRVVAQLVAAKKTWRRLPVVMVDDLPKETLDAAFSAYPQARRGVHLIIRRGDIRSLPVLNRVNLAKARHIVISGDEDRALTAAAAVRQALCADTINRDIPVSLLLGEPSPRLAAARFMQPPIQVYHAHQLSFAPLSRAIKDKHFIAVYQHLTTSREAHSLLATPWRQGMGKNLYDAAPRLRYSSAAGLLRDGQIMIAPPRDTVIQANDRVIMLKNHRDPLHLAAHAPTAAALRLMEAPQAGSPGVSSLFIIGNLGQKALLDQLAIPPDAGITLDTLPGYRATEIEAALAGHTYDLVVCLGEEAVPADSMDDYLMPYLLLIRSLTKGKDCYVCAALRGSRGVQYAYETDLMDLVLDDGRSRLIAANILKEEADVPALEDALLYDEKGLAFISAAIVGTQEAVQLSALAHGLADQGILLLGYLRHLEGRWQVTLNPNKNEHAAFAPEDLLVVVRA